MHSPKLLILSLSALLALAVSGNAQTATTGQIQGDIADATGGLIPHSKVLLTGDSGVDRETVSSASGHYGFALLPAGRYRLEITAPGFAPAKVESIVVRITETATVDVKLKVASVQEAPITVEAVPPLVQTENPNRGTVIEETEIRQLPLPTRNFQQLLTLTPGTSGPIQNSSELGRGAVPIYVDGQRSTSNSVIINGTDANSIATGSTPNLAVPATDSLQEFIIQTSQYDASQGRVAGGLVAAVTKSGTNQFHGNIYEFFRNDVLNANDFFLNSARIPRPPYKRNQFGGTLGGPLLKDRFWFFVSYQGSREHNSTSLTNSIGTVFVPGNLSNDRSMAAIDALAASFGVPPCPAVSCLNPTAQFLLQAKLPNGSFVIPSAPRPGVSNAPVAVPVVADSEFREDQLNTNLDFQASQANRISAKFFAADNPATQGLFNLFGLANALSVPGFGGTDNLNQRVLSLNDTHTFSPRLVNDARIGFASISTGSQPQEPFTSTQLGIASPLSSLFPGMPEISVANFFDLGANPFSDNAGLAKTYTAGDTLSWQKGRHTLKSGLEYKHHDLTADFNAYTRGQIFFLGLSGDPFKDFLGGFRDLASLTIMGSGVNHRDIRAYDLGGFTNDDWRVTSRLTLTLGIRYDYFAPFTEAQGRFIGFDPVRAQTVPLPAPFPPGSVAITGGFVQAGNATHPLSGIPLVQSSLVPADKKDFSPRAGFAWQPLSDSKRLVVRGGYGIYHDRANSRLLNNQLFNFPYYTLAQASTTPIANPFVQVPLPSAYPLAFKNPAIFPFGGPPAFLPAAVNGGVAVVSANGIYPDIHDFHTPYIQQYSLGIQNEFARNWLLDVSYMGSVGRKLHELVNVNQAAAPVPFAPGPFSPGLSSLAVQSFGVHLMQSSANSSYNSLQVGVTKRFSHGLQFLAAYTYSHSLDDYSGDASGTSDVTVVPGNQAVLHNYASSDFDRRHRLAFSGVYDLPRFSTGSSHFIQQVVNGWEVATIFTIQSGTPFSVLTNDTAFVQARADVVAGCNPVLSGSASSRLGKFFDTNCFIPATMPGDFGNTGRNILRGPGQQNADISLIKFFHFAERARLEFRSEFFNAFNNVSFANPINVLASANVGQIVATTTGPRMIQFAMKLGF